MGTFRISQPGSTVATSLCPGESAIKHGAILEIRGDNFRMTPRKLSCVRGFAMVDVELSDYKDLDPEDAKVEDRITEVLTDVVNGLIKKANDDYDKLQKDEDRAAAEEENLEDDKVERSFKIIKSDLVLVRVKVEHTGFTTLNNQRFGAKFVGKVANPGDMLLFYRRKKPSETRGSKSGKGKSGGNNAGGLGGNSLPLQPESIAEVSVEDLIKENLLVDDRKLEILDEKTMSVAMDDFVNRGQTTAILDAVGSKLKSSQKKLFKRSSAANEKGGGGVALPTSAKAIQEIVASETEERRRKDMRDEKDRASKAKKSAAQVARSGVAAGDGGRGGEASATSKGATGGAASGRGAGAKKSAASSKKVMPRKKRRRQHSDDEDEEEDEEEVDYGESDEDDAGDSTELTSSRGESKSARSSGRTRRSS